MMSAFKQMESEGELEVHNGRITKVSGRARTAFSRVVPETVVSPVATIREKLRRAHPIETPPVRGVEVPRGGDGEER